jgi:hypothetical protein
MVTEEKRSKRHTGGDRVTIKIHEIMTRGTTNNLDFDGKIVQTLVLSIMTLG